MGDNVDVAREDAIKKLQLLEKATELQEVCNSLSITIPPAKLGNVAALRTLIRRHLDSDEVESNTDGGLQLFTDVANQVQAKLAKEEDAKVKLEEQVSLPPDGTSVKRKSEETAESSEGSLKRLQGESNVVTRVEHVRALNKDFKLGGVVGDGKNCLGYGTIYYRMMEGIQKGYKREEVMSGVVNAMQAGSELGKYFEGHHELKWDNFLRILRNHYQLENYGKLLMNLGKQYQKANEKVIDFAYRMTRLRDDILVVAANEGAVVDRKMVQEQCLHGLSVGIQSNTIRLELRQVLKNTDITDLELFEEINAASRREQEHLQIQQEQQEAQVNASSARKNQGGGTEDKTNLAILAELKKLTASNEQLTAQMNARVNEMTALKNDFDLFKKQYTNKGASGGVGSGGVGSNVGVGSNGGIGGSGLVFRNKVPICPACQVSGAHCKHCAFCGKDDHKIKNCPTKN